MTTAQDWHYPFRPYEQPNDRKYRRQWDFLVYCLLVYGCDGVAIEYESSTPNELSYLAFLQDDNIVCRSTDNAS